MSERNDPWHVQHTVESVSGTTGYQVNGPASFLIFGDEVDGLMKLLLGIKVDDAIRRLEQVDVSMGRETQQTIPGVGPHWTETPPHTRRYIPGDEV